MSDGLEYLAKEVSKQRVQGVAWFFLSTYSKKHKERDKLKELLSKKKPEFEDLEYSQPMSILQKLRMCVLKKNTMCVAGQSLS